MLKKRSFYSLLLLPLLTIILLASGCSQAQDTPVTVGSDANGQKITLQQAGRLLVRLESNPTTGYRWELAKCDKLVLMPQGEPQYEAASQGKPVAGGGGWETFQFKAQKPGQTHLQLIYHRAFEKGVSPVQTFDLQVTVE